MPVAADHLSALREETEARLAACAPAVLSDFSADFPANFPVERYVACFDALPPLAPYHAVPAEAKAIAAAVEERGGAPALEAYNRLAMLHMIARGLPRPGVRLTEELTGLLDACLARIVADIASPRKGFHRHGNDLFAKDFAVCRGKLVPGGVELIDLGAGIGRRIVIEGGIGRAASRLWFFLARMRGFKPFYELHFDRRLIGEFNEAGYAALYRRVAELLALNPQVRGVVSSSWWHDPRLAEISPELAFVDRYPKGAGARVLRSVENAAATADAIRFAPQRAALYKRGEYRPCVHLLAWPRRAAITWAKGQRDPGSPGAS